MITGGRIVYVEAKRDKEEAINGLKLNIGIDDVAVEGDKVTVQYTFIANYDDKVGYVKMKGMIFATEEKGKMKEIEDTWKKSNRLPTDFAELVINTINYTCGVNGTFVVQPIRLTPPMQMPLVRVEANPEKKEKPKKGAA